MDGNNEVFFSEEKVLKSNKRKNIFLVLLTVILIALVVCGALIYFGYIKVPGIIRESDNEKSETTAKCPSDNGDNSEAYITYLSNLSKDKDYGKRVCDHWLIGLENVDACYELTPDHRIKVIVDTHGENYEKFLEKHSDYDSSGEILPLNNAVDLFMTTSESWGYNNIFILTSDGTVYRMLKKVDQMFEMEKVDIKNVINIYSAHFPDTIEEDGTQAAGGWAIAYTDINGNDGRLVFNDYD